MYIKTKRVRLKNGKIGVYFYVAMSVRHGKQVYPEIIKYIGKKVPDEILEWVKRKNKEFKEKRKVKEC